MRNLSKRNIQLIRYPINLFCEGLQEKLYFLRLRDLINNEPMRKKQVILDHQDCEGGSPDYVVRKAIRLCPKTQKATSVFDYDFKKAEFENALYLATTNIIYVGYSNINFNYWLVLHKLHSYPSTSTVNSTNAYDQQLRTLYGLHNDADIKAKSIIEQIVSNISLADIYHAIEQCKRIETYNAANKKPNYTPGNIKYYDNPDFTIHHIVEKILSDTL